MEKIKRGELEGDRDKGPWRKETHSTRRRTTRKENWRKGRGNTKGAGENSRSRGGEGGAKAGGEPNRGVEPKRGEIGCKGGSGNKSWEGGWNEGCKARGREQRARMWKAWGCGGGRQRQEMERVQRGRERQKTGYGAPRWKEIKPRETTGGGREKGKGGQWGRKGSGVSREQR